jgi:IS5 family transposase
MGQQTGSDKEIVATVYAALAERHPQSRSCGRRGTPAEVVLRLMVLKHMRNWSYGVLEREVRANLVYRDFTRVGGAKTPDAKTMGRWGVALGSAVIKQIHDRIVHIAREHKVAEGPADARRHDRGGDQHCWLARMTFEVEPDLARRDLAARPAKFSAS